jgi:NADH-ubiquinone oxidoreductase chain 1
MESELVAGFMTEHGASIFVFFFLGEYSSLILMSSFMSIFFLGGYHCPDIHKIFIDPLLFIYYYLESEFYSFLPLIDEYTYLSLDYYMEEYEDNDLCMSNFIINNTDDYFSKFSSKETALESINLLIDKFQGSYVLGFKIVIVVFFYIWVRASFPRFRYDQLMSLCWKELLPLVFAYIIFTICLFYTFDMMPFGTSF